jgi:hypothetical protein
MNSSNSNFYKKVYKAKRKELLQISREVASANDKDKINDYISCLHVSKDHRKTITKTIIQNLGKKATPILIKNLELLNGKEKIYQLLLLLQLGHKNYFHLMMKEYIEFSSNQKDLDKYMCEYLTNNIDKYNEEIPDIFKQNQTDLIVFISSWTIKPFHDLTIESIYNYLKMAESISNDSEKAILLLSTHEPSRAFNIIEQKSNIFTVKTLHRSLNLLKSNYDLEQFIHNLNKLFLDNTEKHQMKYRILFGSFLIQNNSQNINEIIYKWIENEYTNILNENGLQISDDVYLLEITAKKLLNINHLQTAKLLSSNMKKNYGNFEFIKKLFITTNHPLGKKILYDYIVDLKDSNNIDKIFKPMAVAIYNYKLDCVEILKLILEIKDKRLIDRANEIIKEVLNLGSINELLKQNSNKEIETNENQLIQNNSNTLTAKKKELLYSRIDRDSLLVKTIKNFAEHICQVCGRKLINLKNNQPYSEVHHIKPLAHDGSDTIDNVINLCPLCHRLFHLGAVGIDSEQNIVKSTKIEENFLQTLRKNENHNISLDSLRYHWITFFVNDTGRKFSANDQIENID